MKSDNLVNIIIPIYNAGNTLMEVFTSLESQEEKKLVNEIIFIDDCSSDNSEELILKFKRTTSYKVKYIKHHQNKGLAHSYNEGILKGETPFIILMHQDVKLIQKNSINTIVNALNSGDESLVAVFPTIILPHSVYERFGFWLKCLFSRFVDRKISNLTGKFDGFNRTILLKNKILFDAQTYRTAGEDGAIKMQFIKKKLTISKINLEIIHLHHQDGNFTLKNLIKKEAQMSEAYGALVRNYGIGDMRGFFLISFRPLLILSLLIPYIRIASIIFIIIYSFLYTKLVYLREYNNVRILILPFVNIYLLFISTIAYIRGLISKKQVI